LNKTIKKVNTAFKTVIKVNPNLYQIFRQFAGNRRFIYNHLLAIINNTKDTNIDKVNYIEKKKDKETDEIIEQLKSLKLTNKKILQQMLVVLQNDNEFLSKSHSQANQEASHALAKAFEIAADPKFPRFSEPNFKAKHQSQSFYLPNQNNIILSLDKKEKPKTKKNKVKPVVTDEDRKLFNKENSIYIKPFDRYIKSYLKENHLSKSLLNDINRIVLVNKIPATLRDKTTKISGITISYTKYNKINLSINYSYEIEIKKFEISDIPNIIKKGRAFGGDLGLKDKLVTNLGEKIQSITESKQYKKLIVEQKELQQKLSKKIEYNKKRLLKKRISKSITKKEYKKLKRSRKREEIKVKSGKFIRKNPIKIDKLELTKSGKMLYQILEKDYKFSKKEWRNIYDDKKVKILQKKIYKLEQKTLNIRKDENHQISNYIVKNFDLIVLEDLTITGMQKLWGNKIKQLQLSALIEMIKYKAENQGKLFIKVNKWYPSSKTCSCCGNYKKILKLSDRIYDCEACNTKIDRDINAAINILREGIRELYQNELKTLPWKRIDSALARLTPINTNVSIRDYVKENIAA